MITTITILGIIALILVVDAFQLARSATSDGDFVFIIPAVGALGCIMVAAILLAIHLL